MFSNLECIFVLRSLCHYIVLYFWQDYERCLYETHNASEAAILDPEECIKNIILPCINVENLFTRCCCISAALAIDIFQTVLSNYASKQLPISWMNSLQPVAVLLCLCEILHETVMHESVATISGRDVRASLLALVKDIISHVVSEEHQGKLPPFDLNL